MDGIVVSNHGGRQVDGAIAALDALPGVVEAVGGRVPVLLDSGVRGGADVVQGARARRARGLLGRPVRVRAGARGRGRRARGDPQHASPSFDLTMGLAAARDRASPTARNRSVLARRAREIVIDATAKPSVVTTPTSLPPCSKASGIIVSASIVRIAPAAKASTKATVFGDASWKRP